MKTPSGQPRSGFLRGVSKNHKVAGSATQPMHQGGWGGAPSVNRLSRGTPSRQVQNVRGWPRTRSVNKKGRA